MWHEEEMWKLQRSEKEAADARQESRVVADRNWHVEQRTSERLHQSAQKREDRIWQVGSILLAAALGAFFNIMSTWIKPVPRPTTTNKSPIEDAAAKPVPQEDSR